MDYQIKKPLNWVFVLAVIAIIFMAAQNASAMPIEIRELTIKATVQQVDTNGDGRPDTFSANYTVRPDGTAVGTVQLDDDCIIEIKEGSITEEANGRIHVSATGSCLRHEISHTYSIHHEFDAPTSPRLNKDGGGYGILLFDTTNSGTGSTQTIAVQGKLIIRY